MRDIYPPHAPRGRAGRHVPLNIERKRSTSQYSKYLRPPSRQRQVLELERRFDFAGFGGDLPRQLRGVVHGLAPRAGGVEADFVAFAVGGAAAAVAAALEGATLGVEHAEGPRVRPPLPLGRVAAGQVDRHAEQVPAALSFHLLDHETAPP